MLSFRHGASLTRISRAWKHQNPQQRSISTLRRSSFDEEVNSPSSTLESVPGEQVSRYYSCAPIHYKKKAVSEVAIPSATRNHVANYCLEASLGMEYLGTKFNSLAISTPLRDDVRDFTSKLREEGRETPHLVAIMTCGDETEEMKHNPQLRAAAQSSLKYASRLAERCKQDGIRFQLWTVEDPDEVEQLAREANDDPDVNGIMILYPVHNYKNQDEKQLPPTLSKFCSISGEYLSKDDHLRDIVCSRRDVEGLGHTYNMMGSSPLARSYKTFTSVDSDKNEACILPCWAEAFMNVLEVSPGGGLDKTLPEGQRMKGQIVTIFDEAQSEVMIDPLISFLNHEGATVYSITSDDSIVKCKSNGALHQCCTLQTNMEDCVRRSTVIITGMSNDTDRQNETSNRIPAEWVQPHTTVVNMSSNRNTMIDEDELMMVPGVTYVPNLDEITMSLIERNLIKLYDAYHDPRDSPSLEDSGDGKTPRIRSVQSMKAFFTAACMTLF